jgi:hypothetical protein
MFTSNNVSAPATPQQPGARASDSPAAGGEPGKRVQTEALSTENRSAKQSKSEGKSPHDAPAGVSVGAGDDAVFHAVHTKKEAPKKLIGWTRDTFFEEGEPNEGVPFKTFNDAFAMARTENGDVSLDVQEYLGSYFIYLGKDSQGKMLWHYPKKSENIFVFDVDDIIEIRAYMGPQSIERRMRELREWLRLKQYKPEIVDFYMVSPQLAYSDGFLLTTALDQNARVYLTR